MRIQTARVLALMTAIAMVGCGDDDDDDQDGAVSVDGGGTDARTLADATTVDATAVDGGVCPSDSLCLVVKSIAAGGAVAAGRVAVVWYQFDDGGPMPALEIGYQTALLAGATTITIPLSAIQPPGTPNLLCTGRACSDYNCACPAGAPAVGFAVVLAVVDANVSGAIEISELDSSANVYGTGFLAVASSADAWPTPPGLWSRIFPEGIREGVQPYRVIEPATGFDQLGTPSPGQLFDLNVCSPGNATECRSLPSPNLT